MTACPRPTRRDVLITIAAATPGLAAWVAGHPAPHDADLPIWAGCVGLLLQAAPLLWRRFVPLAATVASSLLMVAVAAAGVVPSAGGTAVLVVTWSIGGRSDRRSAVAGLAVAAGSAVAAMACGGLYGRPAQPLPCLSAGLAITVVWVSAYAFHTRRAYVAELVERAARLEREEGERARRAVAEERLRIARELHDVVGHAISVIAVQSEAASRTLAAGRDGVGDFLTAINVTSHQALDEMRRLVDVLRPEEPLERPGASAEFTRQQPDPLRPQPGPAALPELIARIRDAGVTVRLVWSGDELRDLPDGLGLAVYRIVQESLTNVLKHSGAVHACVELTREGGRLRVHVRDDGGNSGSAGARGPERPGARGMIGMRERVAVYGGTLRAGPGADGGFRVVATFPVTGTAPERRES
ncbi:sensor histidine kinase [Embleya sp. AB8]|uniref:sensor histidine kinase n=1 Tax=Embleya sp. AB8 TaxID=3156304 RepID=UPI003C706B07